ncbi:MAG: ergothioneine biosynthesis protein EgtB [Parvularcula sp.]
MPDPSPWQALSVACADFQNIRNQTVRLAKPLSDADATLQSMADASPAKWHLAHTTWFFETFVLLPSVPGYRPFHEAYGFLFNSYYDNIGERHPRDKRGMLSRPSLSEILDYRHFVDEQIRAHLSGSNPHHELILLGLHHEQQHQELLLTDILHAFAQNPMHPAYRSPEPVEVGEQNHVDGWTRYAGQKARIGAEGPAFHFDCEGPCHDTLLEPFELAKGAVTVGQWKAFIRDGGYETPLLWLSDGWEACQREGWTAPLYWQKQDDDWQVMTLRGLQDTDDNAPVSHISFYEADAFASWAGARLPTEFEWEVAAGSHTPDPTRLLSDRLRPLPQWADGSSGPIGLFGDVWEWTASAFLPYPGFAPKQGAVGEYNGKFMSGQMVLRGGSCVTPLDHIRPTYRNFFHPDKRWQFSGLRLARNI